MSPTSSEIIYDLLFNTFKDFFGNFAVIFILLITWTLIPWLIVGSLRKISYTLEQFFRTFFFFGGIMHSYWHIFAARLLGYNVRHGFNIMWNRDEISSIGITLNDGSSPGRVRNAFLIGYAPILNVVIIIGLFIVHPIMKEYIVQYVPPVDIIWSYVLLSLFLYGLPDMTDLVLPIEAFLVNYPFFAFELIWGFFFGLFLYSTMDPMFVTFLMLIYLLAASYAESGSSFLTRKKTRISEPWEILLSKSES
ncbi:MAG: hypothetical protein KAR35_00815 [Candidatus Heimdallarchaeota archaeon]|nr:hypothetical protein [Candidatus Heimdallarchaeota archaeon]MCK5047894.1 hypothetical protein [Candidatus Heimdallarchaeota archaeon]